MTLHRFFVRADEVAGPRFPLPDAIGYQVLRVLRFGKLPALEAFSHGFRQKCHAGQMPRKLIVELGAQTLLFARTDFRDDALEFLAAENFRLKRRGALTHQFLEVLGQIADKVEEDRDDDKDR